MEPRTLKLKGSIKIKNITIPVDCGSTHNFMDPSLAKVNFVGDITKVINGQQVKGIKMCHEVFQ